LQLKIAFKIFQPKNRQNLKNLQFSSEIFSKMLPMIFLYFSPFVGHIFVNKMRKFRNSDENFEGGEVKEKHLPPPAIYP